MTTVHDHQAFPSFNEGGECLDYASGLTKREYFAALAMQGLLASERAGDPDSVRPPGNVADLAVDQADELIAALNNPNKGGQANG